MQVTLNNLWERGRSIFRRYFWTFIGYFVSQAGVQVLNFFTGFAIVRHLTKDEYAMYTIVNTLGPALLILSDSGIGNGIVALGRQFWQDDERMGRLVTTGMLLRRKFAFYSVAIVGPLLVCLLYRVHTPILTIILLAFASLLAVSFQLTSAMLRMVLELRQHLKILGKVNLAVAAFRLVFVFSCIFFIHLTAFLATAAATCAVIFEASYLIRAVRPKIAWGAPEDLGYRQSMLALVKKALPLSVFFCVQGQISIWLISIFGSSHQVADIGAVTRLSVIFTTVTITLCVIMLPRYARCNGRTNLRIQVYQILGLLTFLLACMVAFAAIFPQPFILLLGEKYHNMAPLIWLVILANGYGSMVGITYTLNMSKGWVPPASLTIPVELVTEFILILCLDLGNTTQVILFAFLSGVAPGLLNLILLLRRIAKEPEIA